MIFSLKITQYGWQKLKAKGRKKGEQKYYPGPRSANFIDHIVEVFVLYFALLHKLKKLW
jgi:hypothetical protein